MKPPASKPIISVIILFFVLIIDKLKLKYKYKQQEIIVEYNLKQYQRNRAKAYPSIQEQLDLQYWDKINNTDNWEQAINAVKAQYPKS